MKKGIKLLTLRAVPCFLFGHACGMQWKRGRRYGDACSYRRRYVKSHWYQSSAESVSQAQG